MHTAPRLASSFLVALSLLGMSFAQNEKAQIKPASVTSVSASASVEGVRFVARGEASQLRLEIFTSMRERVFDSDFQPGATLDWGLQDQQGQRVADGTYLYVISVKGHQGQVTQEQSVVAVRDGQATLEKEAQPLANQVVDGDITFTSPGQFTYLRDIRLSDNFGGLRFYGAQSLTTSPAGAAIQFFGTNAAPFNGQLYLDSGADNNAGLIFRTAPTGGTISERMRVTSAGNVGIGMPNPSERLHVEGNAWFSGASPLITINNTDSSGNSGLYLRDASGASRAGRITTNGPDIEINMNGGDLRVSGDVYARGQRLGPGMQGPPGPQGPAGPQGATGPQGLQGTPGPTASLSCTTIVQNYEINQTLNLSCPSGYTVVSASSNGGINLVINGQNPPPLPPGSAFICYLTPNADAATGLHCNPSGISGQFRQAQLRCCRTQ